MAEQMIRVDLIDPNPKQPRKTFPESYIRELADSIEKRTQLQAIKVRPRKGGRFEIVLGECRWRAMLLLGRKEIRCDVQDMDDNEMAWCAMVENVKRKDMNPIEEANGYQDLISRGFTEAQIVREMSLGGTDTIRHRLSLLTLLEEIQHLVASGQLPVSAASAISWVSKRRQMGLLKDYIAGRLKTVEQVRHAAIAIKDAEAQPLVFGSRAPKASARDLKTMERLEKHICSVEAMCAAGFKNGECVAARRVSPDRVAKMADKLSLARKAMLAMEQQLRNAGAQALMMTEAGK